MDKENILEKHLRDFYFSIAELAAHIEDCERLCPTDTIMEMCETLAGIMAEQTNIIADIECMKSEKNWHEICEKYRRPLVGERFYSSHIDALCDMMRLAKHLKDISESKNKLLTAIKRLSSCDELPPLNVKLISATFEAIPKVKTLKNDK